MQGGVLPISKFVEELTRGGWSRPFGLFPKESSYFCCMTSLSPTAKDCYQFSFKNRAGWGYRFVWKVFYSKNVISQKFLLFQPLVGTPPPLPGFCAKIVLHTFEEGEGGSCGVVSRIEPKILH